jgi:hypothetical protein
MEAMKRLHRLLLAIMVVAATAACTPADEGAESPAIEDGAVQPGEQ